MAGLPEDAGRASSPAASQVQVSTGSARQQLLPMTCQHAACKLAMGYSALQGCDRQRGRGDEGAKHEGLLLAGRLQSSGKQHAKVG